MKLAIKAETNVPEVRKLFKEIETVPDGNVTEWLDRTITGLFDGRLFTRCTTKQDEYDPALFCADAHSENGSQWLKARVKVVG